MKDIKIYISYLGILICLGLTGKLWFGMPKVAYVRSQDLVYGYKGMIEAREKFKNKQNSWQSEIDTLKSRYEESIKIYEQNASSFSASEKKVQQSILESQRHDILRHGQNIETKYKEAEETMLAGVLNQINSFTEEYGKSKGYDIILGTTLSGSILYGEQSMDITGEVLKALNDHYEKGIALE